MIVLFPLPSSIFRGLSGAQRSDGTLSRGAPRAVGYGEAAAYSIELAQLAKEANYARRFSRVLHSIAYKQIMKFYLSSYLILELYLKKEPS